ncbi:hypothetical protein PLIIFM63780_010633 [Purpureocillium lilacinum]|nr:hypothetical protein PLIIFM63780_010633 [Purpureocillium lilacinum]
MIAALCATNNQLFGKALTATVREQHGIDLSREQQARRWFQGRTRLSGQPEEYWTSNLVCVLDQLLLAYNFHYSIKQAPPVATKLPLLSTRWAAAGEFGETLQVQDWERALEWLEGKCTFCAGREYGEEYIGHPLRQCERGGASQVQDGIGDMVYGKGIVPVNGCGHCLLPREFCSRWVQRGGGWAEIPSGHCKYSEYLLSDGVVGFYSCGLHRYPSYVYEGYEQDCVSEGRNVYFNAEAAAVWLSRPRVVAGVEASEMMRVLCDWIRGLATYRDWRREKRKAGKTKV